MRDRIRRYSFGNLAFNVPEDGREYLVCYADRAHPDWWTVDDEIGAIDGAAYLPVNGSNRRWYAVPREQFNKLAILTERYGNAVAIYAP